MSKKTTTATFNNNEQGWHHNTELGVDVKTILHSGRRLQNGKEYLGVLRRDSDSDIDDYLYRDAHMTFVETLPWTTKRNPYVFRGRYITITRRGDGSLKPNFRPVKMDGDFNVDNYAFEVYRELRKALTGLVEEK